MTWDTTIANSFKKPRGVNALLGFLFDYLSSTGASELVPYAVRVEIQIRGKQLLKKKGFRNSESPLKDGGA